jgi:hypothetical protein
MPLPHSHAAAFAAHPNTQITAVCDISQAALDRYTDLWGPAATYTDFHDMLASEELDLVSIVTRIISTPRASRPPPTPGSRASSAKNRSPPRSKTPTA